MQRASCNATRSLGNNHRPRRPPDPKVQTQTKGYSWSQHNWGTMSSCALCFQSSNPFKCGSERALLNAVLIEASALPSVRRPTGTHGPAPWRPRPMKLLCLWFGVQEFPSVVPHPAPKKTRAPSTRPYTPTTKHHTSRPPWAGAQAEASAEGELGTEAGALMCIPARLDSATPHFAAGAIMECFLSCIPRGRTASGSSPSRSTICTTRSCGPAFPPLPWTGGVCAGSFRPQCSIWNWLEHADRREENFGRG